MALLDPQVLDGIRTLLEALGDDPNRPDLQATPSRVLDSLRYLTRGQRESLEEVLEGGLFEGDYRDLVLVRDIEFASLCEHHLLPFLGHAHVAYVPDRRILGLSKIARIVDHFAARLQVQERLTTQVAECLTEVLRPRAVGVVISATHLCMQIRGVRKADSEVTTSVWRLGPQGGPEELERLRQELVASGTRR
ncbi:MAG TPA: GTP cyclohydrolase I FolE [Myxococcota bacterium]|nr:GTP cyclohydrolase I FolE [Myxococcota bacterium]HQK52074.1 GTP cyclohydrolase I FolE [Myxococcota bacterium]